MSPGHVRQARQILVRNAQHPNHRDVLLAYARNQASPAIRKALFELLFAPLKRD
ncbi:hypothetical protein ACUN9Y_12600 [Halomonas sp. V046]|uniref:hypothetical protein n=1 Tax=Halomonas sp. V046 TaxID=3459611 RepID=UPI004044751B